MFEHTSRYHGIPTATFADGESQIIYKLRRFLPQGESLPLLVTVAVAGHDRLDLIAARTLGDAELFWRVGDANNAMNPFSLVAAPGTPLRVPIPQP
jgi:hypothetical protein